MFKIPLFYGSFCVVVTQGSAFVKEEPSHLFFSFEHVFDGFSKIIIGFLFNSIVTVNTDQGIQGDSTYVGSGNIFYNTVSSAITFAVNFSASVGANTTFNGYFVKGSSDTCGVGNSNLTSSCSNGSTAVSTSFTGAFTGPVTSDMTNSFSSGTGSFTGLNSINLWFDFDHFFRGWGKSGSTFPNNTQQGPCITGNCQIWDWRIKVGGPLHKKSFTASSANVSFQTDICNIYLDGNDSITGAGGVAFMKNGVEAFPDPKGNNNGLCESNEICIYAPNMGAYQGDGDWTTSGHCVTSGVVSNAQIFSFPTDGI